MNLRRDAVHVGVADIAGAPAGAASRPLPAAPDLAALVAEAVAEAAGGRVPHTVVLGTPGLIDPRTGLATDSGVPGWRPDLGAVLQDRLGAPVVMENEVNLGAVAEHREARRRAGTTSRCCGWTTASAVPSSWTGGSGAARPAAPARWGC